MKIFRGCFLFLAFSASMPALASQQIRCLNSGVRDAYAGFDARATVNFGDAERVTAAFNDGYVMHARDVVCDSTNPLVTGGVEFDCIGRTGIIGLDIRLRVFAAEADSDARLAVITSGVGDPVPLLCRNAR